MSVFRTVGVTWDGVDYQITPNTRLLRAIEEEVVIADIIGGFMSGRPKVSHAAFLLASLMRTDPDHVDDAPTEDAIFVSMLNDQSGGLAVEAMVFMMHAIGMEPPEKVESLDDVDDDADPSPPVSDK